MSENRLSEQQILAKSIFDFRYLNIGEFDQYEIQVEVIDSDAFTIHGFFDIVKDAFKQKLFTYVHAESDVTNIKLNEYLAYQHSFATNKKGFLHVVNSIVNVKPEASSLNVCYKLVRKWLSDRVFFNELKEMEFNNGYQLPMENHVDDTPIYPPVSKAYLEPNYYLDYDILSRIHNVFRHTWEQPISLYKFVSVFDINNQVKIPEFKVKKNTDFYGLLWRMHEYKSDGSSLNVFIKPLIKRYGLSTAGFNNVKAKRISLHADETPENSKIKRAFNAKISKCMPLNENQPTSYQLP